jgi:hypothetical protein
MRRQRPDEEATMSQGCWSLDELRTELRRFERELEAAGKAASTVHTYVDRSERFVRWLAGDYEPGAR